MQLLLRTKAVLPEKPDLCNEDCLPMYQPKIDEQQSAKAQLEAENNSITGAPIGPELLASISGCMRID